MSDNFHGNSFRSVGFMRHRIAAYIGLLLLFVLISSLKAQERYKIRLETIISGLTNPLAITHAGDGSGRLFITEQGGRILIYDGSGLLPAPFLDISALLSTGGERGLLSVAFHPNYASNGHFYINYTNTGGDTVIARYSVSNDPNLADPASASTVMTIAQPYSNHNGGQLEFGPEGYLYIGMGDGGDAGDPNNYAQNPDSLLGKMLRIAVDGEIPYGVPPDNPFISDKQVRDEIWALGLRNPWRFSFDRSTGDLFIGDVGQSSWEEIDYQPAGSSGGENYGWRLMEGNHCFNPGSNCNEGSLTLPVLEYSHDLGCSVTGGYRYRGKDNPLLSGLYIYGDFCSGKIWGAKPDGDGNWSVEELLDTNLNISAFGEDENGELYVVHRAAPGGSVYRIVQSTPKFNPGLPLLLLDNE